MIVIPTFWRCDKNHRLEIYHNMGPQWILWCAKCKRTGYRTENGFRTVNGFRWEALAKIDDFLERWCTLFAWNNRWIRLKWRMAKKLVGDRAVGKLQWVEDADNSGYCPICGAFLIADPQDENYSY